MDERAAEEMRSTLHAAARDDANAQYFLGVCHFNGFMEERSYTKAVHWFTKSADAGNVQAAAALGWCCMHGYGTGVSFEKAVELLKIAANAEESSAQYNLAQCYLSGYGEKKSEQKALKWITSASYALPRARLELGKFYYCGTGCEKSLDKAKQWYAAAENADDDDDLKVMLRACGFLEDDTERADYVAAAADAGNTTAQLVAGIMCLRGIGAVKSESRGEQYLKKAAKGSARAQCFYGELLLSKGAEGEKKGIAMIAKASRGGDSRAQRILADCLLKGVGAEKSVSDAAKWLKKSADSGDGCALYMLGELYERGEGVERSVKKAFDCYKKAAECGSAAAVEKLQQG